MWFRVLSTNQQLVDAAYNVLSAHSTAWESPAHLKEWLQSHDDQVFYSWTAPFRLVVGFRDEGGGQWRATIAGMAGDLSVAALRNLCEMAITFLKDHGGNSLVFRVSNLPPSSKFALVYQMAVGMAHGDPRIATTTEEDIGGRREFTLTLRELAA